MVGDFPPRVTPPVTRHHNARMASLVTPLSSPGGASSTAGTSLLHPPPVHLPALSSSLERQGGVDFSSSSDPTTTTTAPLVVRPSGSSAHHSASTPALTPRSPQRDAISFQRAATDSAETTPHRPCSQSASGDAAAVAAGLVSPSVPDLALSVGPPPNPLAGFRRASSHAGLLRRRNPLEGQNASFSMPTDATIHTAASSTLDHTTTFRLPGPPLYPSSVMEATQQKDATVMAVSSTKGSAAPLQHRPPPVLTASGDSNHVRRSLLALVAPGDREGSSVGGSADVQRQASWGKSDASAAHGLVEVLGHSPPTPPLLTAAAAGGVGTAADSCHNASITPVSPPLTPHGVGSRRWRFSSAAAAPSFVYHVPAALRRGTVLSSDSDQASTNAAPFRGGWRAPLAVAVTANIVITVVLLACLIFIPVFSVSVNTVDYTTSRLGVSIAIAFSRGVESNLRVFSNAVSAVGLNWIGTSATPRWGWTKADMPAAMQVMCGALVDPAGSPYVLYMSLSSPYSGYSAFCSQQYSSTFVVGNYITDNTSQPRYVLNASSYAYLDPPTPYCAVASMTPAEYTVDFAGPLNAWGGVVLPWYADYLANASAASTVSGIRQASLETLADASSVPAAAVLKEETAVQAGYWRTVTNANTTVVTYTYPFIDYLGQPSMISGGLHPQGLLAMYPEGMLGVNAHGRAMVVDTASGLVLFTSWGANVSVQMDNWAECSATPSVNDRRSLYMDNIDDFYMAAAVAKLGGRRGLARAPTELKRWFDRFTANGTSNVVVVSRINIDSDYSNMNLFVIHTLRNDDFTAAIRRMGRTTSLAVLFVAVIVVLADLGFLHLFTFPLRGVAAGLRDAAQLRDGRHNVTGTTTVIREIAEMQYYFQIMNRQLMLMKTFLPQGMLGASSRLSADITGLSDDNAFSNPAMQLFPNAEEEEEEGEGEVERVGEMEEADEEDSLLLAAGDATVAGCGDGAGDGGGGIRQGAFVKGEAARTVRGNGGGASSSNNNNDASLSPTAERVSVTNFSDGAQLRLNVQVLREKVNYFRRRYCSMAIFCMHITESDINVRLLNEFCQYFMEGVLPCALRHGGVIELQRPDFILVSFGAHNKVPMHQSRAAKCALEVMHILNRSTPIGPRVGCLLDASEYFVGTCGAAHRNAVVTYSHGLTARGDLIRELKSVGAQILLTQPLASTLDSTMLLLPVDNIVLSPIGHRETILYELRGHVHMLPPELSEVAARQIIRAVRMGFVRMLKGDYQKALEIMEPYAQQEPQAARLTHLCRIAAAAAAASDSPRPFLRFINRLSFTEDTFEGYRERGESQQQLQQQQRHSATVMGGTVSPNSGRPATPTTAEETSVAVSHFFSPYSSSFSPHSPSLGNTEVDPVTSSNTPAAMRYLFAQSGASYGGHSDAEAVDRRGRSPTTLIRQSRSFKTACSSIVGALDMAGRGAVPGNAATVRVSADGTVDVDVVEEGKETGCSDRGVCDGDREDGSGGAAGGDDGDSDSGALFEMFATDNNSDDDDNDDDAGSSRGDADGGGSRSGGDGTGSGAARSGRSSPAALSRKTGKGELPRYFEDYEGNAWRRSHDVLGSGAFATVYRGLSSAGDLVALKCFRLSARNIDYQTVVDEVRLFANLHHENVVQYLGLYASDYYLIEIMEFVPGGSLDTLLTSFGFLEAESMRRYLRDIVRGLVYLHEQGIVHCDIKPHNVLLSMDGQCKLSDFGSAMANATSSINEIDDVLEMRGTPGYMSPEVARGEVPTMKSDVYSLGVAVAELLTGKLPWEYVEGMPPEKPVKRTAPPSAASPFVVPGGASLAAGSVGGPPRSNSGGEQSVSHNLAGVSRLSMSPSVAVSKMSGGAQSNGEPAYLRVPPSFASQSSSFTFSGASGSRTGPAASLASGLVMQRSLLSPTMAAVDGASGSRVAKQSATTTAVATAALPTHEEVAAAAPRKPRERARLPIFKRTSNVAAYLRGAKAPPAAKDLLPVPSSVMWTSISDATTMPTTTTTNTTTTTTTNGGSTGTMSSVFHQHRRQPMEQVVRSGPQLMVFISRGWVQPHIPDFVDDDVADFLRLCLHADPAQRASAAELLRHPWLM